MRNQRSSRALVKNPFIETSSCNTKTCVSPVNSSKNKSFTTQKTRISKSLIKIRSSDKKMDVTNGYRKGLDSEKLCPATGVHCAGMLLNCIEGKWNYY